MPLAAVDGLVHTRNWREFTMPHVVNRRRWCKILRFTRLQPSKSFTARCSRCCHIVFHAHRHEMADMPTAEANVRRDEVNRAQ